MIFTSFSKQKFHDVLEILMLTRKGYDWFKVFSLQYLFIPWKEAFVF